MGWSFGVGLIESWDLLGWCQDAKAFIEGRMRLQNRGGWWPNVETRNFRTAKYCEIRPCVQRQSAMIGWDPHYPLALVGFPFRLFAEYSSWPAVLEYLSTSEKSASKEKNQKIAHLTLMIITGLPDVVLISSALVHVFGDYELTRTYQVAQSCSGWPRKQINHKRQSGLWFIYAHRRCK